MMLSSLSFILCTGLTLANARFVPHIEDLRPRHDGHNDGADLFSSSIAAASSPAGSGSRSTISTSGSGSRQTASTTAQVARASDALLAPLLNSSRTSVTSSAVLASASLASLSRNNVTVSEKVIGIVQAVPNNPGFSPPLTAMPPIEPSKLSAISAALASVNGQATAPTAQSRGLNVTFLSRPSVSRASALSNATALAQLGNETLSSIRTSSGRVFVSATTFPLVTSASPVRNSTASRTISASSRTSVAASSSRPQQAGSQDGEAAFTTTLTRLVTITVSAVPSGRRAGPYDSYDRPHSHSHRSKPPLARTNSTTSAHPPRSLSSPSAALNMPPPAATPSTTITVEAPKPSGIVIIPFDPNAPASAASASASPALLQINAANDGRERVTVTVTVTERIPETTRLVTQTITLI